MSKNPLSNISYTNKDFNSIYTELLDIVKKLTYKWDPTISNESDPGNILIKLNAIIGDKNNYNIDKNVLENFPETLTQDISARSLYKQLAYKMSWYQAATTDIFFKWCGKEKYELTDTSGNINIDKFQLVSDANSEFVYTVLEPITLSKFKKSQSVKAMEGMINTLTINGQAYVETQHMDHNNRIYFNEHNVAENGIFIYNYGENSNHYWTMVENLQVEALGNRYFEFGVDARKNLCYIEFPSDIDKLIGTGLVIKYIVTNGSRGNVIAQVLDRYYEDVTVTLNGEDVLLNSDVIQIRNMQSSNNGMDPEDTDSAYRNYRKTAGTFHTLVTLRDYINAIYNSGLVSNVLVCDRLNDVQSTYSIVTDTQTVGKSIKKVASTGVSDYIGYARVGTAYNTAPTFMTNTFYYYNNDNGVLTLLTSSDSTQWSGDNWKNCYYKVDDVKQDLGAFDLKLYALHTPGNINTFDHYKSTFDLETFRSEDSSSNDTVIRNIKSYIENQKCVQHDFKPILPDIPCMFRNVFPIDIKIIPHYRLDENQITELKVNINKSLFKVLNSSNLDFGLEANYDIIYDTILNADERIKVLILDDFTYTTFATYWDDKQSKFKNIPVSDLNTDGNIIIIDDSTYEEITPPEKTLLLTTEHTKDNNNYLNNANTTANTNYKYINQVVDKIKSYQNTLNYYRYNNTYFITSSNNYVYKVDDNKIRLYSSKINSFRTDIISKSILSGVTPLFIDDNIFRYMIDQDKECLKGTDRITTDLVVCPYGIQKNGDDPILDNNGRVQGVDLIGRNPTETDLGMKSVSTHKNSSYTLGDNENIRFLAPSLTTDVTYSNYTKFELILNGNEFIVQQLSLRYNDYMLDNNKYNKKPVMLERETDYGAVITDTLCTINLRDYAERVIINDSVKSIFGKRRVSLYTKDDQGKDKLVYIGLLSHLLNYVVSEIYTVGDITSMSLRLNIMQNGETSAVTEKGKVIGFTTGDGKMCDKVENVLYIDKDTDISYVYDGYEFRKSLYAFLTDSSSIAEEDRITLDYLKEQQLITDSTDIDDHEYEVTGKLHYVFRDWYAPFNPDPLVNYFAKPTGDINPGDEGEVVSWVQWNLCYGGYGLKVSEISGVYDETTVNLVKKLQTENKLTSNGIINEATLRLIDELIEYKEYFANTYLTIMDFNDIIMDEWQNKECNVVMNQKVYSIPAKSDYMLKENEYITFFWKEEDSDDAPYTYRRYGAGSILRPSFNVQGVTMDEALINVSTLNATDKIYYSELINSMYQKIYSLYDYNDLSGTKTIEMRSENKISIDISDNRRYYYITNNIERGNIEKEDSVDHYKLTPDIHNRYILNNDEYFIVTDSDCTSFEVFGAGTLLLFDNLPTDGLYDMILVDYTEIAKNGLSVFADKCQPINFNIVIQQQQMFNFSAGDQINFSVNAKELTAFNTEPEHILKTPVLTSDRYTAIEGFDISYKLASSGTTDILPVLQIGDTESGSGGNIYGWHAIALLNINSSYDIPQHIKNSVKQDSTSFAYSERSVSIKDVDSTSLETYTTKDTNDNPSDLYLLSNVMINKVGGHNIDITYIDSYGRRVDPYIYIYRKNDILSTDNFKFNSDYTFTLDLNTVTDNSNSVVINKPDVVDGESYILLPIRNVCNDTTFSVSFISGDTTTPQKPINSKNEQNGTGIYFYRVGIDESGNSIDYDSIQLDWQPLGVTIAETDQLIIEPLFKYKPNNTFKDKYNILFNTLQDRIAELDDDGVFNYVYKVPSNELIENPLLAKSFFDQNHIFNRFTLPMADLYMSNDTQSKISLINNR